MPRCFVSRRLAAPVALLLVGGCAPAVSLPPASVSGTTAESTTLLVRLGADTVGVEQYTRTATRMEGVLVSRSPLVTMSRYAIDVGAGGAPTHAEHSIRRGDGTMVQGVLPSLSVGYGTDSITLVGHRATGDTTRVQLARGELLPYLNGSYGLFELAFARLLATGRDSGTFAVVPLNFNVRNTTPLAIKLFAGDSVRINWFGSPVYAQHDGRGHLLGLDGRRSTVKVRVDRVAGIDAEALARTWMTREQALGMAGPASSRDTARATLGGAKLWVDYGRPALRGRDVWMNGVLGDTIWRTGANAATQLHSDAELLIGELPVPAGTYSLWTLATRDGYHLIVNKQFGQWGTEYHADRDLIRVPLREGTTATAVERFTIAVDPATGQAATLVMTWGSKTLSVPISIR